MLTKHAQAAGLATFSDYSVPDIVCLGSTLCQAAIAGFTPVLLYVMLTAYLHHTHYVSLYMVAGHCTAEPVEIDRLLMSSKVNMAISTRFTAEQYLPVASSAKA